MLANITSNSAARGVSLSILKASFPISVTTDKSRLVSALQFLNASSFIFLTLDKSISFKSTQLAKALVSIEKLVEVVSVFNDTLVSFTAFSKALAETSVSFLILTSSKLLQFLNAPSPMLVTSLSNFKRLVQSANASWPIVLIFGKLILLSLVQPLNASFPIFSILRCSNDSMAVFVNAPSSISVNESGKVTVFNLVQLLNIYAASFLIPFGSITSSKFVASLKALW